MISLSESNRRPHIGLKPRRYKKTPYIPPSDETKEGEEGEFLSSDSGALQAITTKIHDEKYEREEKNKIKIEDDFYFIVELFDNVLWRNTYEKLQTLPFKIKEIIDENRIKVKLNRRDYEEFYYSLVELNDFIKDIKQIDIYDKISRDLYNELKEKEYDEGDYTVELFDMNKSENFEMFESNLISYISEIKAEINKIYESEYDTLYSINLVNKELIKMVDTLDSITRVEKEPETFLYYDEEELNFIETDLVRSEPNDEIEKVCIIDSGINRNHSKFNGIIVDTFDFSFNSQIPCNDTIPHGSCVAGFCAYGDSPISTPRPTASIIMLKNYVDRHTRILDNLVAIQRAIQMFGEKFKILNLSFGSRGPHTTYSRALDQIAYRNKLVTITSAGNIPPPSIESSLHRGLVYPDYIRNYSIHFPGDCRNIITVGGCTNVASNLAPINAPSPFTKSNSLSSIVKPDVCAYAGNLAVQGNPQSLISQGYGIMATSNLQSNYVEKSGTSFSASIISNFIARLINSLKIENPALLKALLLSSCSPLLNPRGIPYDTNIQGFGKPSLEKALFSHAWRCNYLLEGEFNSRNPWHRDRYNIWFPPGADTLEVVLVCQKSETLYRKESLDYVRFRVHSRAGTSGYTSLSTLLGDRKCFNTYKGTYNVQRGSRGLWQVEIVPRFSSRYYLNLNMRYGAVVSAIDGSQTHNVWNPIYDDYLIPIVGEYVRPEDEQSMGGLVPTIIPVDEQLMRNVE